jgi:hypothetical protein
LLKNGRGDRIRTYDILVPNQARYRAALRPDGQTSELRLYACWGFISNILNARAALIAALPLVIPAA